MPADSVSIRIYSGIARFPCDSMAFLFFYNIRPRPTVNTNEYNVLEHVSGAERERSGSGRAAERERSGERVSQK